MQKTPRNIQPNQGSNQQFKLINPFFSCSPSSKQKFTGSKIQKPTNSIQVGDKYCYSTDDMIGDGYTSKVYKGHEIQKPTRTYAIKVIDKKRLDDDQIKLIKNQIDLHPTLKNNNIVQCYDVYETQHLIYIILEWCNSGDLAQYIRDFKDKTIPEWRAIQIMEQIISGCKYLVQQGVLHRDLKPANILREGNTFKIADFGFAVKGKKTLIDSMSVGTPLYMPPESIEQCVYSHKSDFFSLGCIMYELIIGQTPWYRNDQKALAKSMKNNKIDLSRIKNTNIKYFIEKTCEISQGSRMSVDQFMSFDFKKVQVTVDFSLISLSNTQTPRQKILARQHTQRLIFSKTNNEQLSITNMAKSNKYTKQKGAMEATFISNHIYFKNAKSQEIKKITAEFEEKFQFCLLLKYLLENQADSILVQESDKKNLKIVLFKHCIFTLKRLLNDFVRTKSFDLKSWCQYKETNQFKKFQEECKVMKQKMEKEFNLQLKGMSLKNLSEVNKKLPELISQYNLSKNFYEKLKQFLREIICHFNQQLIKKYKKSQIRKSKEPQNLSLYYEAFKSLSRYYEYCEQKQQQQAIDKSLIWNSKMSVKQSRISTDQNQGHDKLGLLSCSDKFSYQLKFNDEIGLGKKDFFNHLSPNCESYYIEQKSPRTKYSFYRKSQKRPIHDGTKTPVLKHQNGNVMQPHYYASTVQPIISEFDIDLKGRLEKMVFDQNKKKKINFLQIEKSHKKRQPQHTGQQQKLDTVESHFAKNLCKNFQKSAMTKEEYLTIKKKLRWLW